MKVPSHLEAKAAGLKDQERYVAVSGLHGAHCFNLSLREGVMRWESFPDNFHGTGSWTFGETPLPPAHAEEFAALFDGAASESPATAGTGRQELSLIWREGQQVEYRCFHGVGSMTTAPPARERLLSQCSTQVLAWAKEATTDQSYVCFATDALGLQWVGPDSVVLLRRSGGPVQTVRCSLADLGDHAQSVQSLARHAAAAVVHTRAEAVSPRPTASTAPAFLMATRRGSELLVVQSASAYPSFERLFEALESPPEKAPSPSKDSSTLPASERSELERRLGGRYKLDGTFASLWALEEILIPIRRAPLLANHLDWMSVYLADLFERAFREMGMTLNRESPNRISVTAPISYRFDTRSDLANLVRPPKALPTFHGIRWLGSAGLGSSMVPWYGLSTIFQNNTWALTDHDMIGRQRDRMDRAVPWLRREFVRSLELDEVHHELAEKVARQMVWPPLGYAQNEFGSHNLPKLRQVVADAGSADTRTVLDAFVAGQDRACQLLAAATSLHFAVPPDTRHEAFVYRDAAKFFRLEVPPFIQKSIEEQTATLETPNLDADHPDYAAVYEAKPALGLQLADRVLAKEPNLPVFHCSRGRHLDALKDKDGAMAAYDEAIRLKPDYVQARINRGSMYGMKADFHRGDADFFAALEVQPEDVDLRGNLILNHYFAKSKAQEEAGQAKENETPAKTTQANDAPQSTPVAPASSDFTAAQEEAGQTLRALLRRYSEKQATQNDVLRKLMSYEYFLVPALHLPQTHVGKSGMLFSQTQAFPPGELWVFTDAVAARRTQEVHPTLGLYTGGIDAVALLGLFDPRKFARLWVNPKGAKEECFVFATGALSLLHAWATGLSVEGAAAGNDDVRLRASMSHHPGLLVACKGGRPALDAQKVAYVAATIDRSMGMDRRLGTQSTPVPPAPLKSMLVSAGATGFRLEGSDALLPLDVLG